MNGWTWFFIMVGIAYAASWPFKFVDWIERGGSKHEER